MVSAHHEDGTTVVRGAGIQPSRSVHGLSMPILGCGTWRVDSLECYGAVRRALDLGYRHIDTAVAYDNEAAVGRAIATSDVPREDVFVTTKVKGYPNYLSHDAFLQAARGSLERLGLEYVDLLLVHWWHPDGDMAGTCAAMDELVESGDARAVGVSNFSVPRMERALDYLDAPLLTNQIEYHAYRNREDVRAFCLDHGIVLTAYSPLAEGRLVDDGLLASIGARYGKSAAQVALRWLVQQEGVVTIPKATAAEHQRENLEIFDFALTPDEMRRIREHDGPLWYRMTRDGGPIQRARHRAGRYVPERVRAALS